MNYEISNEKIKAVVSSYGAELVSVVCGKERLWQNDTGEWTGHAPVLFPMCGNCKMIVDGVLYQLGRHGFARRNEFTLLEYGKDFIVFTLNSNEETKKLYPYDFCLTVSYRLIGSGVAIGYSVKNTGSEHLYFSCGSHESYAVDGDIDDYEIRLEKEETLTALLHDGNGLLTGEKKVLTSNGRLALKSEYFKAGGTLIFSEIQSRSATLFHKSGRALARVDFNGFENLLVWKPEHARMICIEPWLNLPDKVDDNTEFPQKKGVRCLLLGGEASFTHTVTYL